MATRVKAAHAAVHDLLILLKAGQRHSATDTPILGTIVRYGEGDPPLIDTRRDISTLDWEAVAPGVYSTTVIFRDPPASNLGPNNPGTTHHQIWNDRGPLDWIYAGDTIEENVAGVAAAPGTFTLHYTGSPLADPRNEAPGGATFTVYLHLPDGTQPGSTPVYIVDKAHSGVFEGATVRNVDFFGSYRKDSVTTIHADPSADGITQFHNVRIFDAPSHGLVGPLNATGTIEVTGRGNAGHDHHAHGWNSAGGLINLFTNIDYDTCLLYTSPSPRDRTRSRMPSSA